MNFNIATQFIATTTTVYKFFKQKSWKKPS